ncbi:TM2 domain-containing protein [candidate division WOR-3 bacterium]|nr:TM2 domain-containing protein [candidate division WOR-3 bacterium]
MYCKTCGKVVAENAVVCPNCGAKPLSGNKFCWNCGAETDSKAEVCVKCGVKLVKVGAGKDWLVALLLSIFLGGLGIDRFYLGYIGLGILKLLTGAGLGIWWLIDLILIACNKLKDAEGNELSKT